VLLRGPFLALALAGLGPPEPTASAGEAAADPEAAVVVLSLRGEGDELQQAAVRAIRAHMQGSPVELRIEHSLPSGSDLRSQMRAARELAQRHAAQGVFWLDLEQGDEFLLYLFEREGLRVLVRRIPTSEQDRPAALESLGVIVGSSSEALAAGETIGMTPVTTATEVGPGERAPEPAPTAVRPTQVRSSPARAWKTVRVSLAYAGTSYAPNLRWQQGGVVALAAAVAPRLYVGADYTLLSPSRIDEPVSLELWRHPIAAHFGFHQPLVRWLALDAELAGGVTLDRWRRTDLRLAGVRAIGTLAAWVHLRFRVVAQLSVDVGVGAEVPLNRFDYTFECTTAPCPDARAVVPDPVRGRVRGGLSYSF
jgi:hypothetical protein